MIVYYILIILTLYNFKMLAVQSLEERVDQIESAVQAGNTSLQHAGGATPAKTITVMSTNSECAFKYER